MEPCKNGAEGKDTQPYWAFSLLRRMSSDDIGFSTKRNRPKGGAEGITSKGDSFYIPQEPHTKSSLKEALLKGVLQ